MMGYYFGDMFGFGGLFMLIFWGAIIFFIVWLVKGNANHKEPNNKSDSAINILKERYVKGEINKEEFEAKKKDIMN